MVSRFSAKTDADKLNKFHKIILVGVLIFFFCSNCSVRAVFLLCCSKSG